MVVSDENDLLEELEFRRGRTVRDKLLFPERAVRAASLRRELGDEVAEGEEHCASSRGRTISRGLAERSARASSVFPASLRHFDDVNELAAQHDYYEPGYSNEGLERARRALSEARIIAQDLATAQDHHTSSYLSTEKRQLKSSAVLASQNESRESGECGTYKITVTPRVESWAGYLLPRRRSWSSRDVTNALLAKYNPSQFPDFIFGTYGHGQRLNEPISSSLNYHTSSLLDDGIAHPLNSSRLSKRLAICDYSNDYKNEDSSYYKSNQISDAGKYDRANRFAENSSSMSYYDDMAKNYGIKTNSNCSEARNHESTAKAAATRAPDPVARAYFEKYGSDLEGKSSKYFNDYDVDYDDQTYSNAHWPRSASAYEHGNTAQSQFGIFGDSNDQLNKRAGSIGPKSFRIGDKYYDYGTESRVSKISPLSKFYHYYIPKHYEATPMLGGYMVPVGTRQAKYGWKY